MNEITNHISQDQLEHYLNKAELVSLTAEQIIKDFVIFGLDIVFSGITENAYQELHQQLISQIDYLLRISPSKLVSVLYRIDLSEDELQKGEKELPNYNSIEAMAHLIIVRELKKVLSRKFYTNN